MSEERHQGGCLCGGVRYEVTGPLRDVVVCHCSRCRRTHGHAAAYTKCAASDLVLVEDDTLRWYEFDGRRRGFCARCGASVLWRTTDDATVSITAGTLREPTGLRTIAHIFTAEPGDYYEHIGEGEHYPAGLPDPG